MGREDSTPLNKDETTPYDDTLRDFFPKLELGPHTSITNKHDKHTTHHRV